MKESFKASATLSLAEYLDFMKLISDFEIIDNIELEHTDNEKDINLTVKAQGKAAKELKTGFKTGILNFFNWDKCFTIT
ncbi:hypothetical protein C0583_05925 [Candidatus Parcubacteria bacterium]|mgnify:CR=1 FL=1|nr:MAG: hypothetical protein C0583_05925 [Candidatus Parcubacteria bacterium]